MVIQDSFEVNAPVDEVWAVLQEIPRLGGLFPGVKQIEQLTPVSYRGELIVKVGPLRSSFRGEARILEQDPPKRIVAEVQGEDRATQTTVKVQFDGSLSPVPEGTRLEYTADIALRGRLAQFGTAVIHTTAKRLTAEFANKLREELEA